MPLQPEGALTVALPVVSDKECMSHAAECVRLAGLTDDVVIRDQLLDLAQDWIFAAQHAPRPPAMMRATTWCHCTKTRTTTTPVDRQQRECQS